MLITIGPTLSLVTQRSVRLDLVRFIGSASEHTFACRLRAIAVAFEDPEGLLAHWAALITVHCPAANMNSLIVCTERICNLIARKSPALLIMRSAGRSQVAESTGGKGRTRSAQLESSRRIPSPAAGETQ